MLTIAVVQFGGASMLALTGRTRHVKRSDTVLTSTRTDEAPVPSTASARDSRTSASNSGNLEFELAVAAEPEITWWNASEFEYRLKSLHGDVAAEVVRGSREP